MKNLKMVMFLLMALLLSLVRVDGATIKGGVVYTVESAREEAFRGMEYEISMEPYERYMRDPGYRSMGEGKKPKVSKRGRVISWFSSGTYSARYYNKWDKVFYYDSHGVLEAVELNVNRYDYPYLTKKYDIKGKLDSVFFTVAKNDTYIYDQHKKLIAHWIGDNCYEEGEVTMKRW